MTNKKNQNDERAGTANDRDMLVRKMTNKRELEMTSKRELKMMNNQELKTRSSSILKPRSYNLTAFLPKSLINGFSFNFH